MIISGYIHETKNHQSQARSHVPYQFSNSNIEPLKEERNVQFKSTLLKKTH